MCEYTRGHRAFCMKAVLGILAVGALLGGCAGRPTSTVSPKPAARHTLPALSEYFGSEQLTVNYPASWSCVPLPLGPRQSEQSMSMAVRLSRGGSHENIRIALIQPGEYWYRNADGHDLARIRAIAASRHEAILQAGFVTISRVRLAELELEAGHWRYLTLTSAKSTQRSAQLEVSVACPNGRWPAQRATVMAILDSMQLFSGGA
jgi:hypothetical protein